MTTVFQPVISLANAARFKVKFIILAAMFYLPLFVTCGWIILEQQTLLAQYEEEINGFNLIEQVLEVEAAIAETRKKR